MASRPLLFLLDGHSLAYRHFFAYATNPLTTSDGRPTSAVYGFARNLMDILEKDKPAYLAVCFDDGLSGRDTLYSAYKGTRDQMPTDLSEQIPHIFRLVEAFNMPILTVPGYEADDIMGTIATQGETQGVNTLLVTGDGDLLQLLSPHVGVRLRVRRKEESGRFVVRDLLYDANLFREEYGFEPAQLVDFKALKGDTSDNIPGVAGIGDKTATDLLQKFGTIEALYTRIDEVSGALKKKLVEGEEAARLSRQLATIRRDVPVTLELEACVAHDFDRNHVEALFREFEFYSLVKQLDKITAQTTAQLPLFDMGSEAAPEPEEALVETVIVRDEAGLQALVAVLNAAEAITFDVETTSTDQMSADLVGIALSTDGEIGYYIPVGHEADDQLPLEMVLQAVRPALTNPNIPKHAHNADYDRVVLSRYGVEVAPITFDTMIAEWVRDPQSKYLGLKGLVQHRFNARMTAIDSLIGTGKKQVTMASVPVERAAPYAAADAVYTHRLVALLRDDLDDPAPDVHQETLLDRASAGAAKPTLLELFETLEMPLIPVIGAMEQAGVLLDTPLLARMSEDLARQMAALEEEIYGLCGGKPFNINSPKQLNDILFGALGLKVEGVRKTSHGYSTAADVLENMRGQHPVIEKILQYREIGKLKGTYVDALPSLINRHTGRVHTSYNQTGSSTGRLSSSNPNLQNIPIRTDLGREVRQAFIAAPGMCLLAVDYSQVELRIMAHITREPTLLDAFRQGQDIHAATAAIVNGIALDAVTYEQRSFAKRVNFGLLYGMGAFRLARDSSLTLAEADAFIKRYFERLPNVLVYIEETKRAARDRGYLSTLLGRRRYFPMLHSSNQQLVRAAEREAINMPIQGTAADIIKRAMITLHYELQRRGSGARMILQVHDELVLEVPEDDLEATARLVVEIMEGAYELDPPLRANAESGINWLHMHPVTR